MSGAQLRSVEAQLQQARADRDLANDVVEQRQNQLMMREKREAMELCRSSLRETQAGYWFGLRFGFGFGFRFGFELGFGFGFGFGFGLGLGLVLGLGLGFESDPNLNPDHRPTTERGWPN